MKGSRNSVCPLDQHVVTMENQIRPSSLGTPRKLMVWSPLQAPEPLSLFFFLPSSPSLTSFLTLLPLRYWTVHTLEKHWWPHSQSWSQGLSSRLYPAPAGPDSDSDSELSLDEHSSSYASSHTSDSEDDGGEAEDKWNPAGGPAHSTPKGKQWRHGDCEQCGLWSHLNSGCVPEDLPSRVIATQDSSDRNTNPRNWPTPCWAVAEN